MKPKSYTQFKKKVDAELSKKLEAEIQAAKASPYSAEILRHAQRILLAGGKRLRPSLFYFTYVALGGSNKRRALQISMVFEFIHLALLIQDDIMDNADVRHDTETIHATYTNKIKKKTTQTKLYGTSVGLTAANLIYAIAYDILVSQIDCETLPKAVEVVNDMIRTVNEGQLTDIHLGMQPIQKVTEQDVLLQHNYKTASYTFIGPMSLAALLAKATAKQKKALHSYGYNLGLPYQAHDDILGLYGDEDETGKSSSSDILEGKKTLLMTYAYKKAPTKGKKLIEATLGNTRAKKKDIHLIRELVAETGSLQYSRDFIAKHTQEARHQLESISLFKEGEDFLLWLTDYIGKRNK